MLSATVNEIASMLGLSGHHSDATCQGVSTDTRSLQAGNLFVALNGPNHRGADFVPAAEARGAAAAIVDTLQPGNLPQLLVDDTRLGLQRLAAAWRKLMAPVMIGITGSNGKTTMRSMIAACCGEKTLATHGNLNNDIGVPLTLLRLAREHEFAVIEMGANHVGEIAVLAHLAEPRIGIVTNAGPAHLEGFGSLQGVADGKGELFAALGAGDTAVINADDQFFGQWCDMAAPASIVSFGASQQADVRLDELVVGDDVQFRVHAGDDSRRVRLQLRGAHNAHNACGAIAVGLAAGLPLETMITALGAVVPEPGRQRVIRCPQGGVVIDDTYNANPASMRAAAEAAVANYSTVTMVIGDMGELGDGSAAIHAALGDALRQIGVARLVTLGELAAHAAAGFGAGAKACKTLDAALAVTRESLVPDQAIVVKGSRSMRMERVVDALVDSSAEVV